MSVGTLILFYCTWKRVFKLVVNILLMTM